MDLFHLGQITSSMRHFLIEEAGLTGNAVYCPPGIAEATGSLFSRVLVKNGRSRVTTGPLQGVWGSVTLSYGTAYYDWRPTGTLEMAVRA